MHQLGAVGGVAVNFGDESSLQSVGLCMRVDGQALTYAGGMS